MSSGKSSFMLYVWVWLALIASMVSTLVGSLTLVLEREALLGRLEKLLSFTLPLQQPVERFRSREKLSEVVESSVRDFAALFRSLTNATCCHYQKHSRGRLGLLFIAKFRWRFQIAFLHRNFPSSSPSFSSNYSSRNTRKFPERSNFRSNLRFAPV